MIALIKAGIARHIGRRIIVVVGAAVGLGLALLILFYADRQERNILAQNERTLIKVTESVIQGLRTVMQAGYADIGQTLFDRLRHVGDVVDLRILRADGTEAFHDNATVRKVNERLGRERFPAHGAEDGQQVVAAGDPFLNRAVTRGETVTFYHAGPEGERMFTLLVPVANGLECHQCHGDDHKVRGVLKLTTSVAKVEEDIRTTRLQSVGVLVVAMLVTLITVNMMVRSAVVKPIDRITQAMNRAARGDLTHEVPVLGDDELGQMANSFNHMIRELLRTYTGLRHERNKLSTIILGAQEGIVVTDRNGTVVLVNPAVERLLDKSATRIIHEGMLNVLDDPAWMALRRDRPADRAEAETVIYRDRVFSVLTGGIRNEEGEFIGSAVLIRDITEETRLQQELQRQGETDPLTGLYNRRYFDQRLTDEFKLARRYDRALSVFLFDVDHFKKFNDTYGHDQGDRVLQFVGAAMRETAEPTQVCCRYGGEEFVAILPGATGVEAVAVAERLRAHIEAMEVDGLKVTVTIGVAAMKAVHPAHAGDMVKEADAAMYAGKQAGRNQVREAAGA